jgi:hypothetical protein
VQLLSILMLLDQGPGMGKWFERGLQDDWGKGGSSTGGTLMMIDSGPYWQAIVCLVLVGPALLPFRAIGCVWAGCRSCRQGKVNGGPSDRRTQFTALRNPETGHSLHDDDADTDDEPLFDRPPQSSRRLRSLSWSHGGGSPSSSKDWVPVVGGQVARLLPG